MQKDQHSYSAKYNGYVTAKNNYIWGGAMCLAWNQLKNSIIKAPIKLGTKDQNIIQEIQNFNTSKFTDKDIDASCIYIKSGYGKKTLDQINTQVKQKFPQKTTPPLDLPMQDDSIISYAYLLKKLSFQSIFERLPGKDFYFNDQYTVHAFYASNKQQRKQIQYSNYKDRDNFTVAIKSTNPNDLLFLVKSQDYLKVQDVFKLCEQKHLKDIGATDQFTMPVIQLDLHHSYDELKLGVLNKGFTDYRIQQMFENIKLKIDESGAKVQNEAVMVMNRCMMMPQQMKQFVLDRSFWIVMKQVGKHPYLAVYIRNPVQTQ